MYIHSMGVCDIFGDLKWTLLDSFLSFQFTEELIGRQGLLMNLIDTDRNQILSTQNPLQLRLIALKCIVCLLSIEETKSEEINVPIDIKEYISHIVVKFLLRGYVKSQDEFLYCKVSWLTLCFLKPDLVTELAGST